MPRVYPISVPHPIESVKHPIVCMNDPHGAWRQKVAFQKPMARDRHDLSVLSSDALNDLILGRLKLLGCEQPLRLQVGQLVDLVGN